MPPRSRKNIVPVRVWAPASRHVALKLHSGTHAMSPTAHGWWQYDARDPLHGADYAFILDGGAPLPDPRSPYQPNGVHGNSRFVDHRRFPWTDQGWQPPSFQSAIIYELHIGTFTPAGTFEGVIEHLDHLVNLGITHIELLPVAEFPGTRGWGYEGVDLYAPHHSYGGPDGLKQLVDACHRKGLAVILDVVYNHLGPNGNYLSQFGPYYSDRHRTPWGQALNLDGPGSSEVRRYLCDNALMWLRDYHFDGLRLDAVHELFDTSSVHFLEQLSLEVDQLQTELARPLVLIAESDLNAPRIVQSRNVGGYGLTAQWSDDFHHSLHVALTGDRQGYYADFTGAPDLGRALEQVFVYQGQYSEYRLRNHGRPILDIPHHHFVAYLQNHDQIGNRAKGDRIGRLTSQEGLLTGAAILFLSPFVPMLFQGEEWGASTPFQFFTSHEDPTLAKSISEGRKHEFSALGWRPEDVPDPQSPATFQNSKLDWSEPDREPHRAILQAHRQLMQIRRSLPNVPVKAEVQEQTLTLTRGDYTLICDLTPGQPFATLTLRNEVLFTSKAAILAAGSRA